MLKRIHVIDFCFFFFEKLNLCAKKQTDWKLLNKFSHYDKNSTTRNKENENISSIMVQLFSSSIYLVNLTNNNIMSEESVKKYSWLKSMLKRKCNFTLYIQFFVNILYHLFFSSSLSNELYLIYCFLVPKPTTSDMYIDWFTLGQRYIILFSYCIRIFLINNKHM